MLYTTFHIQKDGRVTLGTGVHKYKDCSSLKNVISKVKEISGEVARAMPKCHRCFTRSENEKYHTNKKA